MVRRGRAGLVAVACVAALSPPPLAAWGFAAHRLVTARAVETLPPALRPLFEGNAAWLAEHSIDPDLWRGAGRPGEDPNHFLDLDAFGSYPFPDIPRDEATHLARHGREAAERGRVPWRVGEVYAELVAAFRAGDPARALEQAAVLSHYLGDAHVPLHSVLNYDGQLTGQRGLHARWESHLVERFQRQVEPALRPAAARAGGAPVETTFAVLLESFASAGPVLESDRAVTTGRDLAHTPADDRYDDLYYSRLYEREQERLQSRLRASAERIGSMWLSAWEDAGRPAVPAGFRFPYVRGQSRAILLSLDGSSAPVVADAMARGVMPQLARLRAAGASASGVLPALPVKTATAHASLYTGAWPDRHGIGGNDMPVAGGSVAEMMSGYRSTALRAEPLWVTAARQGLQATVASATQVYPFGPFLDERRFGGNYRYGLTLLDGYQHLRSRERMYRAADLPRRPPGGWLAPLPEHRGQPIETEVALEDTPVRIDGLLYDDPADATAGLDTLLLCLDRDPRNGITLKPVPPRPPDGTPAFGSLTVRLLGGPAAVHFRLFQLSPDGSEVLLYRTAPGAVRASREELEPVLHEAVGGFVGNSADRLYRRGALGPPVWEGGDGTAERRYLETTAFMARLVVKLNEFCLDRTGWQVFFTYLPAVDEALHLWLPWVDGSRPDDPAAGRLRGFLDDVLQIADGVVGALAARAGPDTFLVVTGDHGLRTVTRRLRPNVALAAAGLLAVDAHGRVDLARTQAVYFAGNLGTVMVNAASRPGGVVAAAEEADVRRRAAEALLGIVDPVTGKAVVTGVRDAHAWSGEPALGGPAGADLYLDIAPGYEPAADLKGLLLEEMHPEGSHLGAPEDARMQTILILSGAGVAGPVDLGPVRQIDVAPTVSALLGIDPPAEATGRVLEPALARRPAPAPAH